MTEISILHLSDIHFRRKDKEPRKTYRQDVREKMLTAIQEHLDKEKTVLDFVVVTGDIAFSGGKKEYDEAGEFFKRFYSGILFIKNFGRTHRFGAILLHKLIELP